MRERAKATVFVLIWIVALMGLAVGIQSAQPAPSKAPGPVSLSLSIEGPSWTIPFAAEMQNATAFGLLQEANLTLGFELRWVMYGWPYEDVFVTSINGTPNDGGSNLWWQYCVNGQYASVGAANQGLADGDTVVWRHAPPGGPDLCD